MEEREILSEIHKRKNLGSGISREEYIKRFKARMEAMSKEQEAQRIADNANRMLERSGVKDSLETMTFSAFITNTALQREMKRKALSFAADYSGHWLFIAGQSGSGKTHICTAALNSIMKKGVECRYFPWRQEQPRLYDAMKRGCYESDLREWQSVELLFIDDMFKTAGTRDIQPSDIKMAYEMLNYRVLNKLSTIISTEYTLDKIIDFDEAVGSRIAQMAKGYIINIAPDRSKNYRLGGLNK